MLFRSTLAFVTLSALYCSAQDPKITTNPTSSSEQSSIKVDAEEQKKIVALWRDRAERFTAAAQEDEWRIGVMRPVLEARLAQAWWKVDPLRAKSWLAGAVEEVTTERRNEPDELRDKRLRATESVFRICEYLKQDDFARKILESLVAAAKDSGYDPKRQNSPVIATLTSSIMVAATEIARDDPARAEDMAALLIQFHSGGNFVNVNGFIRAKDSQAADKLFSNALDTAADSRDYNMMYSLMQDAFPFFSNPGPTASDAEKELVISKGGAMLSQPFASDQDRQDFCREAPLIANHLLPYLAASQQGVVQASIQSCPAKTEDQDQGDDLDACNAADACLKLADTAKTSEQRARYKTLAASQARGENDSVRALSILDSLTPEEREWVPDWVNDYWIDGMDAMKQLYKDHDSQGIQRLIDRSPDSFRAQMVINLEQVPDVRKDKPYATSMLLEAHRVLEKFPTDNPLTYLLLCNLYSELLPTQAPQVFGFAVEQLNHIEYPDPAKERKKAKEVGKEGPLFQWAKPGQGIQPVDINATLLDEDEPFVIAALKSIQDPETRIGFRLTFLRYSLKRYQQELQKGAKEPPPSSKNVVVQKDSPK